MPKSKFGESVGRYKKEYSEKYSQQISYAWSISAVVVAIYFLLVPVVSYFSGIWSENVTESMRRYLILSGAVASIMVGVYLFISAFYAKEDCPKCDACPTCKECLEPEECPEQVKCKPCPPRNLPRGPPPKGRPKITPVETVEESALVSLTVPDAPPLG